MSWLLDRLYGPHVDPTVREVFAFLPRNPPRRGQYVLVDGVRCQVTRVRVTWEGREWTLHDLRVKEAPL